MIGPYWHTHIHTTHNSNQPVVELESTECIECRQPLGIRNECTLFYYWFDVRIHKIMHPFNQCVGRWFSVRFLTVRERKIKSLAPLYELIARWPIYIKKQMFWKPSHFYIQRKFHLRSTINENGQINLLLQLKHRRRLLTDLPLEKRTIQSCLTCTAH